LVFPDVSTCKFNHLLPTSGKPSEKNHAFLSYKFFIMVMNNQKWLFFTETTITDCLPTLDTKNN